MRWSNWEPCTPRAVHSRMPARSGCRSCPSRRTRPPAGPHRPGWNRWTSR
jgi:hypothetical protein